LHHGQAESGSPDVARPCGLEPRELREERGDFGLGHSRALVAHEEANAVVEPLACAEHNGFARAEFKGVRDVVQDDLLHAGRVPNDLFGQLGRHRDGDSGAGSARGLSHHGDALLKKPPQIEGG
jgi:hypothetical protein